MPRNANDRIQVVTPGVRPLGQVIVNRTSKQHLLLVLPVPAFTVGKLVFLDEQACYGLELWLENFDTLTLACPTFTRSEAPPATRDIDTVKNKDRLSFQPLPPAYSPVAFVRHLPATIRTLSRLIDGANYLHFAIGGFFGDWGAVASIVASSRKLPFAVWTDRVESSVIAFQSHSMSGARRAYYYVLSRLTVLLEQYVISRSALGLFNGMDCFDAYRRFSSNPHLVANYNFAEGTHIAQSAFDRRVAEMPGRALRFAYVGRAHRDKGIFDWVAALANVQDGFHATWFGDGPELETVRAEVGSRQLESRMSFPGNAPHAEVLAKMKDFDAFVFCHKTRESPRCLVEALACGLPLVGYETAYSRQLIQKNEGGVLTPMDNIEALSEAIQNLVRDRDALRVISKRAIGDGRQYSAQATFAHRSSLMKTIRIDRLAPRGT